MSSVGRGNRDNKGGFKAFRQYLSEKSRTVQRRQDKRAIKEGYEMNVLNCYDDLLNLIQYRINSRQNELAKLRGQISALEGELTGLREALDDIGSAKGLALATDSE